MIMIYVSCVCTIPPAHPPSPLQLRCQMSVAVGKGQALLHLTCGVGVDSVTPVFYNGLLMLVTRPLRQWKWKTQSGKTSDDPHSKYAASSHRDRRRTADKRRALPPTTRRDCRDTNKGDGLNARARKINVTRTPFYTLYVLHALSLIDESDQASLSASKSNMFLVLACFSSTGAVLTGGCGGAVDPPAPPLPDNPGGARAAPRPPPPRPPRSPPRSPRPPPAIHQPNWCVQ